MELSAQRVWSVGARRATIIEMSEFAGSILDDMTATFEPPMRNISEAEWQQWRERFAVEE